MKKLIFLFVGTMWLFCSCDDASSVSPDYENVDVVTGMTLTDFNGSPIGKWKQPNQNPGTIAIYPNPSNGEIFLYSPDFIEKVWIVAANCMNDTINENIEELSIDLSYDEEDLTEAGALEIAIPNFNTNAALNLSDHGAGFYRVFYKIETEDFYWTNIYIDPTQISFPSLAFLDDLCN